MPTLKSGHFARWFGSFLYHRILQRVADILEVS